MRGEAKSGGHRDPEESTDDQSSDESPITIVERRPTKRWQVLVPVGLGTAGVGIVFTIPGLLLVTGLIAGVLAYRGATTVPDPRIEVSRSIDPTDPEPGDVVTVTTTITNVGDRMLPDLRCVEQLPGELHVIEGSPRVGAGLAPGESCTIEYAVTARRGTHEFGGIVVYLRDLASSIELEYRIEDYDRIDCIPDPAPLSSVLLRSISTPYTGRQDTDEAGEGVEFYGTRSYRPTDSLRRVDWNKYAETGELVTRQFKTERRMSIVLVADVRTDAYVAPNETANHAIRQSTDAIGQLFVSYLDLNHAVGIATLGRQYWLAPQTGKRHRTQGITDLGTNSALTNPASETTIIRPAVQNLLQRFPDHAQIIFCSPLADQRSITAVRLFEAFDHPTTVLSPDPTCDTSPGHTVEKIKRRRRIDKLRRLGVPVINWPADQSLEATLAARYTGDLE